MFAKRVRRYLRKKFRKLFVSVGNNRNDSEDGIDEIYKNIKYPLVFVDEIDGYGEIHHSKVIYENTPLSAEEQEAILQASKLMSEFADNSLEMFANLPDVPLLKVFSYLNGSQILELLIICKRWHSLVMSAVNQLPKVDFSLVITENPYANLLPEPEEYFIKTNAEPHFQCHLESIRKVWDYSGVNWTLAVGERTSPKMDFRAENDDDPAQHSALIRRIYSNQHFNVKQIAFQDCTPSVDLLDGVGLVLSRNKKRPSMMRFDHCTLSLEVEPAVINLLREFKNDIKVIIFKGCHAVDAITDKFMNELDQVEQFFVDPYSNGAFTSITDTALDNIARNFKTQPFHLMLPRRAFTEYGLQTFLKAIGFEDDDVNREFTRWHTTELSKFIDLSGSNLDMVWKLTFSMLSIAPFNLTPMNICPEYEYDSISVIYDQWQA